MAAEKSQGSSQGMRSYFLTKYALSNGIKACDGGPVDELGYVRLAGYGFTSYRLGRDVHETEAAAKAAAEAMRKKKVASLQKQIAQLEKMTFKVKA